ncbi:hypothetical protein [Actinomadura sp. GTD37]|uniref:hypothetical protein n=1 Tax=Actinomadura sp. GTD37 TaxID=1778030 RepID=UPI0035BF328A
MGNLADCSATSWVYLDPDQIRRELEAAFPGVRAWLGDYTGHWWALVNDRLVEADTPRLLADKVREVLAVQRAAPPIRRARRPRQVTPPSRPARVRPKRRRHVLLGGWR